MSEDNECNICMERLENDVVTLKCGHRFHYKCIFNSFYNITNKKWTMSFYQCNNLSQNKARECPYCRKDGGFLPLKANTIPVEKIHREYSEFKKMVKSNDTLGLKKYFDENKCMTILQSGVNKGKQCSRKKKCGHDFCGTHLKSKMNQEKKKLIILD